MTKRGGRSPSQRQLRVGEELRHALAVILERGDVRDPGLGKASITVTEVRVSPDLRNATAFVMPLGGGGTPEAVEALTRASPFLRRQLARVVHLKYVPAITFAADRSFEEARRIDALLHEPVGARDLAGDGDGDEEAENHGA